MFRPNPITAFDFYKADHRRQYPDGTELVYSNFTPRSDRLAKVLRDQWDGKIVVFGLQVFIKLVLKDLFDKDFFQKPKEDVLKKWNRRMLTSLGPNRIGDKHIAALHDLGYLPIEIRALPEGSVVDSKIPVFTIRNTIPEFFWLTNALETMASAWLWKPMTSATIAKEYRKLLEKYALETGSPLDFVLWQGHDFSFRGMVGFDDPSVSGAGHLVSLLGTDTVPAIDLIEELYNANAEVELIGGSVGATEHSVMCMGMQDGEYETFVRLLTEVYPDGIVSIVSDTWDFWKVMTDIAPRCKDIIMAREGKTVFRPDSGDPVRIIAGYTVDEVEEVILEVDDGVGVPMFVIKDTGEKITEAEFMGAVACLWRTFGGTTTEAGYKLLDQHVGLIYGDSITLERANEILRRLKEKGFASANVVFGIGSFTYEFQTRDTFGFAMKATAGAVNGEYREIFKDPKTDSGTKKSARGFLRVEKAESGDFYLRDQVSFEDSLGGELAKVFENGNLVVDERFSVIRERMNAYFAKFR